MTKTSLFLSVGLLSAVAASPVLAQTNTNHTATTASATTGNWLKQPSSNDWLGSHLKGVNVYNNNNDKLGSIDDLIMDKSGRVQAAVIDVGGFLGMGVHRVAVPFDQLHFQDRAQARADNRNNNHNAAANPAAVNPANTGLGNTTTATGAPTGNANYAANNGTNADNNVPDRAILNMTADQLKAAPEFHYNS